MTETRVGFLCNIASSLQQTENGKDLEVLRSYYLMRCKEVTGGYGLPVKQFSLKVRCPHCYLEWSNKTSIKIKPIRLTKKQKRRLVLKKANKNVSSTTEELQRCNQMEQTCLFCNKTTVTTLPKLQNIYPKKLTSAKHAPETRKKEEIITINTNNSKHKESKQAKTESTKKNIVKGTNVYSNAYEVFSLKNEQNTLASAVKAPTKIRNNKKRKDKFAGLCQKAVLAATKQKQEKIEQNKLGLFLKPSLG